MNVICVIGDLVHSRAASNRAVLQRRFQRVLKELNRHRGADLLSPGTLTLGDEFQAIYRSSADLWPDICLLLGELHPHRMRFAIGLGTLTTPLNARQAIGMDGPAFHVARDLMERVLKPSGRIFGIASALQPVPPWIEAALELVSPQIATWKPNRHKIFRGYFEGMSARDIADEAGLSAAAVYKNIAGSRLDPMSRLLREISAWADAQVTS